MSARSYPMATQLTKGRVCRWDNLEPTVGLATFSACGQHRFELYRRWDSSGPLVAFIGLNPTREADEYDLDNTCRRCANYARVWGFGIYAMLNIFALRDKDPRSLYSHADPIGDGNDATILEVAGMADLVVCAWGTHGKLRGRGQAVAAMLREAGVKLHCLRVTKDGFPSHPLYLPASLKPIPYEVEQ